MPQGTCLLPGSRSAGARLTCLIFRTPLPMSGIRWVGNRLGGLAHQSTRKAKTSTCHLNAEHFYFSGLLKSYPEQTGTNLRLFERQRPATSETGSTVEKSISTVEKWPKNREIQDTSLQLNGISLLFMGIASPESPKRRTWVYRRGVWSGPTETIGSGWGLRYRGRHQGDHRTGCPVLSRTL